VRVEHCYIEFIFYCQSPVDQKTTLYLVDQAKNSYRNSIQFIRLANVASISVMHFCARTCPGNYCRIVEKCQKVGWNSQ